MMVNVIGWLIFFALEAYWCYNEKQKMYLYDLWCDKY